MPILPQTGLSRRVWAEKLKLPIHCPSHWLNVKRRAGQGEDRGKATGVHVFPRVLSFSHKVEAKQPNVSNIWARCNQAQVLVSSCLGPLLPIHRTSSHSLTGAPPKSPHSLGNRKNHHQVACADNLAAKHLGQPIYLFCLFPDLELLNFKASWLYLG